MKLNDLSFQHIRLISAGYLNSWVWIVCLLVSLAATSYYLIQSFMQFYIYGTMLIVRVSAEGRKQLFNILTCSLTIFQIENNRLPFPKITICNLNPFQQSKVQSVPELKPLVNSAANKHNRMINIPIWNDIYP